jgi:hypothetical protein
VLSGGSQTDKPHDHRTKVARPLGTWLERASLLI